MAKMANKTREKETAIIINGKKYKYVRFDNEKDCCPTCAFHEECWGTGSHTICYLVGKQQDKIGHFQEVKDVVQEDERKGRVLGEATYQALKRLGLLDTSVRAYNMGKSDYAQHIIQPWSIWQDWELNPWDADIVKRVLRKKEGESRKMDYEKIIHVCEERIRQIESDEEGREGELP